MGYSEKMKKIHLIRHAKSGWDDPDLRDIERPLNTRGHNDSSMMAEYIMGAGCTFKSVFVSPAIRAQSTIENIAGALPDKNIKWEVDEDLYNFSSVDLLNYCLRLDDDLDDITIVGHNPAITDFTNRVTGEDILNVPTCGYVQMTIDGGWKELGTGAGTLTEFLTPKKVKSK